MKHAMPKYLFNSLDEVRRQLTYRDQVAVFLDLDGTLAPITRTPKLTRLKSETRKAIQSLAQNERYRVAIVSGRAMDDLKRIVKLEDVIYAGNHGLEINGQGLDFLHTEAGNRTGVVAEVCRKVKSRLQSVNGVIVEFKTLTASLHYRLAAASEFSRIRATLDDVTAPFREQVYVTEGRCVLEVRPAVSWDKGSGVNWILGQLGVDEAAAIYVGDDKTDEDAFRTLKRGITINVGMKFGSTTARYFVRSSQGVLAFIQCLPRIRELTGRTPGSYCQCAPDATGM